MLQLILLFLALLAAPLAIEAQTDKLYRIGIRARRPLTRRRPNVDNNAP